MTFTRERINECRLSTGKKLVDDEASWLYSVALTKFFSTPIDEAIDNINSCAGPDPFPVSFYLSRLFSKDELFFDERLCDDDLKYFLSGLQARLVEGVDSLVKSFSSDGQTNAMENMNQNNIASFIALAHHLPKEAQKALLPRLKLLSKTTKPERVNQDDRLEPVARFALEMAIKRFERSGHARALDSNM